MNENKDEQQTAACVNETETAERAHLQHVISRIEAELRAFSSRLGSRLSESRDMVVAIQEQKRDMDHAEKAVMRQAVNVMTRINEHGMSHQEKLARLADSPYFGRIDLASTNGELDHPVYIGLYSFTDPDTDEQLVHDWRAPISSMFYDFELGQAHFEAPSGRIEHEITRKRQYQIEDRSLKLMLETSLSIQDDILRDQLSRASDDTMKNIVATIQREQNAIIRNDQSHALIIQGAAGSGKTSIALHRIAFLLYRFREEISSNEILIVSPNRVFGHYISKVLPELGEAMIQETTMEAIAGGLLGAGFRFQTFAEQVAKLLAGKDRKYAERVRFKATPEFVTKLDAYMQHIRNTNVTPTDVDAGLYSLTAEWLTERFEKHRDKAINDQLTAVLVDADTYLQLEYEKKLSSKERTELRADISRMIAHTTLKALYKNFYTWLDRPDMFKSLRGGRYEYADVFPLLYLQRLVERPPALGRMKHVVIDQMQDYTPVQYKVIDAQFPCKKTILGDSYQSVSPLSSSSAEAIAEVLREAQCMYMHKSYRSTIEITNVAQCIQHNPRLEPIERHGDTPALITSNDSDAETRAIRAAINEFRASDHNTLGIICKTDEQAEQIYDALGHDRRGVHLLDARSTTFSGGIMIATAYLAKGLEFDRVIVPFCHADNYATTIDRHMLYVACTRAMHMLTLTATGEPSPFIADALERDLLHVRPMR